MVPSSTRIRTCIAILTILLTGPRLSAQSIDAAKVEKGIEKAVNFLLGDQLPDGGWPDHAQYPYGVTSLVTLALLNTGMPPEHPKVAKALANLDGQELSKTYTVALQTMAFCTANPNKYAPMIERNTKWLIAEQSPNGGWGYGGDRIGGYTDPSNSQFALLALHEAQRAGVEIPEGEWKKVFGRAKSYWRRLQEDNGSFKYTSADRTGRGSMTCAGIASMVIVGAQLGGLDDASGEVQCCGAENEDAERIERGLDWLGDNFTVVHNPVFRQYHLYYIYALERVGRLTGRRFIGDYDWYREGASYLINVMQDKIGGRIVAAGSIQGNAYSETAFALLFLAKGKRQTIISRLKFRGVGEDWNKHSAAVQHLTAHTEAAWKRDLSWQNIDLSKAKLEDLLETPVLFISGTKAPRFTRAQKKLLKDYVEQQGGFIFAEACNGNGCDGREFEAYFQQLAVELFDQPLEKLPPEHPIWYAESRIVPSDLPDGAWLYGVQTCCRLGVVFSSYSLSCRWELNLPYGIKPNYSQEVQSDLDTATKIGLNVLAYATGKELKEKLDAVTILEEVEDKTPTDRGVFFLPTLRHNAGADDAPKSVPNLVQWLNRANPFRMNSEKRFVGISESELAKYPIVYVHGRGKLAFTEPQREVLKNYLDNGGFIFCDAICADQQFADSFRQEMRLILGEPLARLPAGSQGKHPIFSKNFSGFDLNRVSVIDPDRSGDNIVSATRLQPPLLEAGKVRGRIAVIFSPLDLSCALESKHSLQCHGYVREDAARIGINVLLYALQN